MISHFARTLRERCPWIPLHEAMAWTRPGAALDPARRTSGVGGFMGSGYSRTDILMAWAHYAAGYGPLYRHVSASLGPCSSLESEDERVKEVYGRIVLRNHRLYVGYERLARKAKGRLGRMVWPGTQNMSNAHGYLEGLGLLRAIDSVTEKGEKS